LADDTETVMGLYPMTNGGPAFPVLPLKDEDYSITATLGMSLRDYFAALAMSGWMSSTDMLPSNEHIKTLAENCYTIADAMLAARGG
jgi:hypothetical protein